MEKVGKGGKLLSLVLKRSPFFCAYIRINSVHKRVMDRILQDGTTFILSSYRDKYYFVNNKELEPPFKCVSAPLVVC